MTFDEWVKTLDQDDEMYFRRADARIGWDAAKADSAHEIERLRIRCDGYQASRDWAINKLAATLNVEADTARAVEFYARLAAEEIERLRAELAASRAGTDFAVEVGEEAKNLLFKQRDEIERLRAELAAAQALLREAMDAIDFLEVDVRLVDRIRAALGESNHSEHVQNEPAEE